MRRFTVVALVLFSLAGGTALAQQFSTLEERMTYAEFKAAGLEKLSPEELAALNDWLARKASGAVAATVAQDRVGFNSGSSSEELVVSSITGPFKGWKGRGDRITLDNGQVWEIVDSTSRLVINVENPGVTIEKGVLSAWFLRVEGYNTRARVKRIK